MFTLVGLILLIYGAVTNGSEIYAKSLGMNINVVWGLVLLCFGLLMFFMGRAREKRLARETEAAVAKDNARFSASH
jgi:uncharacterized membrane protein HdeD (DUF308 family)